MEQEFAAQQAAAEAHAAQQAAAAAAAAAADPAAVLMQQQQQIQQQATALGTLNTELQMLKLVMKAGHTAKNMPKPDVFDGQPAAVDGWLWRMEKFLKACQYVNDIDCLTIATAYLVGAARDWWRSLEQQPGHPTTWADFSLALKKTFQPVNPRETARNRLARLRHVSTVPKFAAALRNAAFNIPNITDEEMKDKFTRGLKKEVQMEVAQRDPKSFEEAVQIAERYESVIYSVKRTTNEETYSRSNHATTTSASFRNGGSSGPTDMQLGAANAVSRSRNRNSPQRNQFRPRRPKLTPELKQQLVDEGKCFFCREPGHFALNCPEKAKKRLW